jgi:hypothetical protein
MRNSFVPNFSTSVMRPSSFRSCATAISGTEDELRSCSHSSSGSRRRRQVSYRNGRCVRVERGLPFHGKQRGMRHHGSESGHEHPASKNRMVDEPKTTPLLNEYRAGIAKAIQLISEWLITFGDETPQVIALWAAKEEAIDDVWLVGSRAWGSPRPDSDWDLYLKMPAYDCAASTMFSEWDETVSRLTGLKTHLISAAVPFQEVGKDLERDGVLLYRRE